MPRRSWREILFGVFLAAVHGCSAQTQPARTQLEVREAQTRAFDTADTQLVMKAMLNVLQDEGYVVKNAVVDLGLITASKEIDLAPGRGGEGVDIFGSTTVILGGGPGGIVFGGGDSASWRKTEVIDCTSNVSEYGEQTRVRLSFQRKVIDNRGVTMSSEPIEEPAFYQDFFSKVDKAIFLQKEQL